MKCNNCNKELNFPEGVLKQNRVLENFGEKAFFGWAIRIAKPMQIA